MKVGIDLGGTKTEGILIDSNGKELKRKRIKTEKNYKGTINGIVSIVKDFENEFGNCSSIGIGMPGAVSLDSALVKNANSIWLNGQPLKKHLEFDACTPDMLGFTHDPENYCPECGRNCECESLHIHNDINRNELNDALYLN